MATEDFDFEFLGLKLRYPSQRYACIYSVVFLLCISGITGAVIYYLEPKGVQDVVTSFVTGKIKSDGKYKFYEENGYTIAFWTPNKETFESIKDSVESDENLSKEEKKKTIGAGTWQIISENKNISDFEAILTNSDNFYGWRHYRVVGKGRTPKKIGEWWLVSPKTGIDIDYVARIYKGYWNNTDSVYFERYGSRHQYDNEERK